MTPDEGCKANLGTSGMDTSTASPANLQVEDLALAAMHRTIQAKLFGEALKPIYYGRFRVLEVLGAGGMGIVYAAQDEKLGRVVALKVVRYPEGPRREGEQRRLQREARALAKLSHPNVIHIYEVGEVGDDVFLAMEYVHGSNLQDWLRTERRTLNQILAVFGDAGRGLAAAHAVGILHRDFKPSNVLISEDGRVRLIDFGLALGMRPPEEAPDTRRASEAAHTMTAPEVTQGTLSGAVAGTPAYMPPEAARHELDARGDQFSFCVSLLEAVSGGTRPFGPSGALGITAGDSRRRLADVMSMRRVPGWLREILARGLAFDPAERYSSMEALLAALTGALRRRRRAWIGGTVGLALAGMLAGIVWATSAPSHCPLAYDALAEVWNPSRHEAVRRAIVGTELPYANSLAHEVSASLDAFGEQWLEQRQSACEATWVRKEQSEALLDRSMLCFDDGLRAMASLVALLREGGREQIARSNEMLTGLPDLARCRNPRVLTAEEDPPAASPEALALAESLQRAEFLLVARMGPEALALIESALTDSARLELPRLEARALLLEARVARIVLRDRSRATEALHRAYVRATASGHDNLVWSIWNELARVYASELQQAAPARVWLAYARGALDRQQASDVRAEVMLLDTEAMILGVEARYKEAEEVRRAALARLVEHLPADHLEVLWARVFLAQAVADRGGQREALALIRSLLDEQADQRGAEHPVVADLQHEAGLLHYELAEFDAARELFVRERTSIITAFGADNPSLASIDLKLGQIAASAGQYDEAIEQATSALDVLTRRFPAYYSERIEALATLAELYRLTERREPALDVYRELLAIQDEYDIELDSFGLLVSIGDELCLLGRCAEALPYYSRLLGLLAAEPTVEPVRAAFPLQGLGRVHLAEGAPALALPFLNRAMELLDADPESVPDLRMSTAELLADTLQTLHIQAARTRQLRAKAEAIRQSVSQSAP